MSHVMPPKGLRELRSFDTHQADFAKELGISQAQLSRYEKGKSEMGAEVVLRIALKFGKSMEWVLTGKDLGLFCWAFAGCF